MTKPAPRLRATFPRPQTVYLDLMTPAGPVVSVRIKAVNQRLAGCLGDEVARLLLGQERRFRKCLRGPPL